jgi:hypothetical protein
MGRCSILFQAVAAGWVGGKGRTYEKGRMNGSFRNKLGEGIVGGRGL